MAAASARLERKARERPPPLVVGPAVRFQRLGPNADGDIDRGTGGCWSNGLVVVRLVARIASGVAGSWFGVSGSWSRMRHHSAAAEWSSGKGPAAAADRRRWVASKPGHGEVGQPFLEFRQEWVRGGAGDFGGEQPPPVPLCVSVRGCESLVELMLDDSGSVVELGW